MPSEMTPKIIFFVDRAAGSGAPHPPRPPLTGPSPRRTSWIANRIANTGGQPRDPDQRAAAAWGAAEERGRPVQEFAHQAQQGDGPA